MQTKPKAKKRLALLSACLAGSLLASLSFTLAQSIQPTETPAAAKDSTADDEMTEAEARAARALEARIKARAEQEEALTTIEESIALSEQRRGELEQEIAQLKADRQTIQTDLIDTANRIQTLESSISDREARLKILFADQTELRVSLAEQRDSLSRILAALQRIGRNPPPAIAVRPNDALDAVRSAILLSTLVPEIRLEASSLATQLEELVRLHTEIEQEKGALQGGLAKLEEEQQRLDLLMKRKQEQEATTQQAAADEEQKTAELAARAQSIEELIEGMEKEIEAARLAVREAEDAEKRAIEQQIETKKQKIAALKDAARLSPAIPFDKMRGLLRLPANGSVLKEFGANDGFGGQTKGLSVATRAGAQVTSPADGWIVYAGPFRSFGKLLIINAGDGYHIVLSGLDELFAEVGSFVLTNEPIGTMQQTRLAATDLLDAGSSKPVLYMELRKDGVAVDPTPWWTAILKEKAGG
ncbi:peptidoglycan DD-metalloendopeptidase family protein [uncultured Cohaesibacter sp.]|uniref:murein hydrolase activator EnvC family protein n=1 Tax=uncultured Cohaesibacter sp. TaxID=1002546 RepID=UPI0029C7EF2E|nr:peptidoglycan DD-metalloendopeptidase family protein [uncultured Cohaesibacter sp.]